MPALRVIAADLLFIDPDIQWPAALSEVRWRRMAAQFLIHYPPLTVVPTGDGRYSIIDGRHRWLAGCLFGIKEFRCDVHDEVAFTDVTAKARLKLLCDYERRNVGALEHFYVRLRAADPVVIAIDRIASSVGYEIGKRDRSSMNGTKLGCVTALEQYYLMLGDERFRRMLSLNTIWIQDPNATSASWIGAMGIFARDGYDDLMTPSRRERAKAPGPGVLEGRARSEIITAGGRPQSGVGSGGFPNVSYRIGELLRKRLRLPVLPVVPSGPKDKKSRPLGDSTKEA